VTPEELLPGTFTRQETGNLPKLVSILAEEFVPIYGEMMKKQLIDEIEAFGLKLKDLSERIPNRYLSDYSQKILVYADRFEIDSLLSHLNAFPKIMDTLNASINAENHE
jgi:hypothetical protein